jgi:hypothetical protein
MFYVLIPHRAITHEDYRMFTTFAAAEQAVFGPAKWYELNGGDPDWCILIAYDGIDEVRPVLLYRVIASDRLAREPYPIPSS